MSDDTHHGHGKPAAKMTPRRLGQLPALVVPDDFDKPLSESELAAWERGEAHEYKPS
ncbi:MAG: hypothetical protein K0U84_18745 [Actinomycetia bacterium]|nr:hypothetical protein [Actinomycetes bacterium]